MNRKENISSNLKTLEPFHSVFTTDLTINFASWEKRNE